MSKTKRWIALALRDSFDELGLTVVGPFSRVADAMNALRTYQVDAAVLDINLGGEMVYPLADVLAAAHIPFAFITGYGAEEIKHRYARVPVLQKPIESDALKSIFPAPSAAAKGAISRFKLFSAAERIGDFWISQEGSEEAGFFRGCAFKSSALCKERHTPLGISLRGRRHAVARQRTKSSKPSISSRRHGDHGVRMHTRGNCRCWLCRFRVDRQREPIRIL